MAAETVRATIQDAAFRLFDKAGYEATSVDDIAAASGVSRSTYFRLFGTKEAVVFPDHEALLGAVATRLAASTAESALAAVADAVRLVLFHYVGEGDKARLRYRLTSQVDALRERELLSGARYQRLFRQHISAADRSTDDAGMRAELMAAAVVAAHNRVLRRWLREEPGDPQQEIDAALVQVRDLFEHRAALDPVVVVVPRGVDMDRLANSIQQLADEAPRSRGRQR